MARIAGPIVLCVTSGKGGVGKTSISVNLAVALARKGERVLVMDGDLGLANVDVLLKLSVKKTIRDVLETASDPLESVIYVEPNLGILPASSGVPEMVTMGEDEQELLGEIIQAIAGHFDYVIVDTAAGIGPSVMWFNTFATYNLIVLTPDPTSLTDAYALMKVLSRDYERDRFHLVLNLVTSEQEGRQTYEALARVVKRFLNLTIEHLATIPRDKAVQTGVREQVPFVKNSPHSKAARAIDDLADRVRALERQSQEHL